LFIKPLNSEATELNDTELSMDISAEEMNRRYARLRQIMADEGLAALIVIGNTSVNGSASFSTGSFRYLSNFYIMSLCGVLVFLQNEAPIMLVPSELSREKATRVSCVSDVRHSLDYSDVARILEERGMTHGKVGIISLDNIPVPLYLSLKERLPDVTFVDGLFTVLPSRFIKSAEEMKLIAQSAKINDQAFQEVLNGMRPGMKEYEVANIVESCQKRHGADRTFDLISSGPFANVKERAQLFYPGSREIQTGDWVTLEITCSYAGYWSQLVRVVSVGEASPEAVQLQTATMRTLETGLEKLRIGMRVPEYFHIMAEAAAGYGFKLITPMGHFAGLDLVEGRIDNKTEVVFAPGMTFIVHPHLVDSQGRWLLWGQTYFMTADGAVSFNRKEESGLYAI
jgi:Xaa-Pro aminopeptidase